MTKTITFFSTKGGVGKTTLALNTAISLSRKNKKVLLLEMDFGAPFDMSKMCNLKPKASLVDIIHDWSAIKDNKELLKGNFLIAINPFLDFLPSILSLRSAGSLTAANVAEALGFFKALEYDFIIIDGGKNISDITVNIFDKSNLILLVINPDVLSLYQTELTLEALEIMTFPLSMVKGILNRFESKGGVSSSVIKALLPIDIISQVPSDGKAAGLALNMGIPIIIDTPDSKITSAIDALAVLLATREDIFVFQKSLAEMVVRGDEMAQKPKVDFWTDLGMSEQKNEKVKIDKETDNVIKLKKRAHLKLIEEMNLKRLPLDTLTTDVEQMHKLKEQAEKILSNILTREIDGIAASLEMRRQIIKEIIDEALGLGPLEDLLRDATITEVMVNNKDQVYIERAGKITLTDKHFTTDEQVKIVIERILAPLGRRIDESSPYVDARLPDGSRVNAIIPPLALTGPSLTIRKFRKERFSIKELVGLKSLSNSMADFLKACVVGRKNIMVSGGTGSGKTTFLNILSLFIPDRERIITIEDSAELKLDQDHWIRLESKPPNIEGKGAVTIRELFRNTLRMRPDRIIVGECRSIEALDMLQAMNTGHDGSMSTLHANSTHDVLIRLDSMILMSGVELPIRAIREMIASALDLIVHTARLSDGTRRVLAITEITGMVDEMHVGLKDIFSFVQSGVDKDGSIIGEFKPTGYIPSFFPDMKMQGILLSEDIFKV